MEQQFPMIYLYTRNIAGKVTKHIKLNKEALSALKDKHTSINKTIITIGTYEDNIYFVNVTDIDRKTIKIPIYLNKNGIINNGHLFDYLYKRFVDIANEYGNIVLFGIPCVIDGIKCLKLISKLIEENYFYVEEQLINNTISD